MRGNKGGGLRAEHLIEMQRGQWQSEKPHKVTKAATGRCGDV